MVRSLKIAIFASKQVLSSHLSGANVINIHQIGTMQRVDSVIPEEDEEEDLEEVSENRRNYAAKVPDELLDPVALAAQGTRRGSRQAKKLNTYNTCVYLTNQND